MILRAVRETRRHASLTLVGPGTSAETEFSEEDIPFVRALGFVDSGEAERTLRSADVLLMPSLIEGMPLAVLEALAFGIPIVGFDIEGTAAAAGDAGVLVAPGDVNGCANALAEVISDRAVRRRLSEKAFARARRLTWSATAEGTLAAYEHAARIAQRDAH
jgi:glycosyltransferase involved in cell wall biosynthesis